MEKQLTFLLGVAVGSTITSWLYLFFYKKNSGRKSSSSASSIFNMEPITSLNLSQSKTLYNLNCCSINTDEDKPTPSDADLHRVAIHEAGHVVASFFCEATSKAIKVTIVLEGNRLGLTTFANRANISWTAEECFEKMMTFLGGMAAEELFIKKDSKMAQYLSQMRIRNCSSNCQEDLAKVYNLAKEMTMKYGMNPEIGPIGIGDLSTEEMEAKVLIHAGNLAKLAYDKCLELIEEKEVLVKKVAARLLQINTIEENELNDLIYK
uniref:Peptidase M41 domain-containing protein n=1 Tax=Meloidogyne javanica TaxID=6303 RepID=A0A915MDA5_MELJA